MPEDRSPFPVVNFRGYDRDAVDGRLAALEQALAGARKSVG